MPRLCRDRSAQIFVGADRKGVMWSTLRSAIDAILAFSVLVPLVEPPHTSHEYEQPQMLVSRYGPGSSQDRCHLQHSCGHEWDEGAASGRRNAPSISQDRTRRSARVMAMQHGHGRASGAAACGIMPRLCGDSSVQIFVGADRKGVMWSTLRLATDAKLAFFSTHATCRTSPYRP